MSPGVLLVISPRMQKLTPNPGRDFARVRILTGLMTSDACANGSNGNSPSRQLLGIAGCQAVVPRNSPRTSAPCRDFSREMSLPPCLIRKSVEYSERCLPKANSEPRHCRGLFLDDRKPAAQKAFNLRLFSRFRF